VIDRAVVVVGIGLCSDCVGAVPVPAPVLVFECVPVASPMFVSWFVHDP